MAGHNSKSSPSKKPVALLMSLLPGAICLVAYICTAARGITWGDSAEIAQAVHKLGVIHPTGYPLFTLLQKFLTSLMFFVDEPATRLNYVVGFWGAAAVLVLMITVARLSFHIACRENTERWICHLAGAFAGLLFGLSPLFWSQARIAELYTFHVFLVALCVFFLVRFETTSERRWILWAALAMGMGLAHHTTIMHLFPAVLLYLLLRDRAFFSTKLFLFAVALASFPLVLYLYLPVADLTTKGFAWGGTSGWTEFWRHVSGQAYYRLVGDSDGSALKNLADLPGEVLAQLSWAGIVLFAVGAFAILRRTWQLAIFLLVFIAIGFLHYVFYHSYDNEVYLCPPIFAISLMAGVGFAWFAKNAIKFPDKEKRNSGWIVVCLVAVLLLSSIFLRSRDQWLKLRADLSFLPAMTGEIARTLEPGSILVVKRDNDIFSLLYFQNVKKQGVEVAVIDENHATDEWYGVYAGRRWPWLDLSGISHPRETIRTLLVRYFNKRKIFERGLYEPDILENTPFMTVNRGFVNEIVLRHGDEGSRIILESFLTDKFISDRPALPKREFGKNEPIIFVARWARRIHNPGLLKWKTGDDSVFTEVQLNSLPKEEWVYSTLLPCENRPAGAWTVEMTVGETVVLKYPFKILD